MPRPPEDYERAKDLVRRLLDEPGMDFWPHRTLRRKRRQSEEERAQFVHRKTILIGGVAVFAYVYKHRGELSSRSRKQIRGFETGIVSPGPVTTQIGGELLLKKVGNRLFKSRQTQIIEPVIDEETFEKADLNSIEEAVDRLLGSNVEPSSLPDN